MFIRPERTAAVPPPFFRLACCSLHRCYRIVADVGLSICFDTTRCSFCFSGFGSACPGALQASLFKAQHRTLAQQEGRLHGLAVASLRPAWIV